jgi:DNA-binding XRE family transcriptional regulator
MSTGHSKWSEIRREVTPDRRARIDAIKEAMADAATLAEVRHVIGVTQNDLASRLGKTQATVSELERRDDVYLSTIGAYIEALGGHVELTAVFPDEGLRIELAQPKRQD